MPYARDYSQFSRAYAAINHRGGYVSYAASPDYNQCLGSADPLDCLQNGPNPINSNPILAPINKGVQTVLQAPGRIGGEAQKEIVKPIQDEINNLGNQIGMIGKGFVDWNKPCNFAGKFMLPFPCWLFYVFIILGLVVLIKVR